MTKTLEKAIFYHGSPRILPPGTILLPRKDAYKKDWGDTDFYAALEFYRPPHMIPHKDAVFMCDNDDDLDSAGGATDYVFTLEPLGPIEKHSLEWSTEISCLAEDAEANAEQIKICAENYWNGIPHPNQDIWEYLTSSAKILSVKKY